MAKLVEVELPNEWSTIWRTSVSLGRGVGPKGMIRTRYGGTPLPVMLIDKFEHCCGGALKTQEYPAENVGRVMSWRRTSGAKRSRDSMTGRDRK